MRDKLLFSFHTKDCIKKKSFSYYYVILINLPYLKLFLFEL